MTTDFIKKLLKPSLNEALLFIMAIDHPDFDDGPIRVINDIIPATIGGDVYSAVGFSFTPPASDTAIAGLVIDDVDRTIRAKLLKVLNYATVTIGLVSSADKSVIQQLWSLHLIKGTFDKTKITFELEVPTVLQNSLTGFKIDSTNFPGLYI